MRLVGVAGPFTVLTRLGEEPRKRLHSLTKNGRVPALLVALAAHLRCELLEFAIHTVRGEQVAEPGRRK